MNTSAVTDALTPVRTDILRRADDDAAHTLREARAYADARKAAAAAECEAITVRAMETGRRRAAAELTARRIRTAERQRNVMLAAQRSAYSRWRAAATAAVLAWREGPAYGQLEETLRTAARRVLGPDVGIEADPAGGIVARSRDRVLDLRLVTLAARAIEQVEPDIGGLWA
ncbi:hypothetical protein [Nocardia africana]|uniref:V-type ATP synthase subunit E n=1 Tax=Nocardia africana TaxID=134964 RepID=A0ABW6NRG0_9NOCA